MDKEIEELSAAIQSNIEVTSQYIAVVRELFTQEDVNGLRHIASLLEGEAKRKLVLSLADRIEILIPPVDGTQ